MNIPEFNQTWLQRAAFTVHFLRRAGGGAGVPVIYDGNALIMHSMPFLFSFWFIYDQIHWKVICRSWFQLCFFSYLFPSCFPLHPKRWNESDFMYYLVELDCSLFLLIGESQFMYYILGRLGLGLSLYIGLRFGVPIFFSSGSMLVSNTYIKITSKTILFNFFIISHKLTFQYQHIFVLLQFK